MAMISLNSWLQNSRVLIFLLFLRLSAAHQLEYQTISPEFADKEEVKSPPALADQKEVSQPNATIQIFSGPFCKCPYNCEGVLQSNFSLAPEVCLTGTSPSYSMIVEEIPQCVGSDGKSFSATLVTYGDRDCAGYPMVQQLPPSLRGGPCIEFPRYESHPWGKFWSFMFHCHQAPFNESLDAFKRQYTNGGYLQEPVKPHVPFDPCENRPPRLVDGGIWMAYSKCEFFYTDPWKAFTLPTDTCQKTYGAHVLQVAKPAVCKNDSRARLARYSDGECKMLHDITDVLDTDMGWNACRILDDTTPRIGSFVLYCDGPGDVATINQKTVVDKTKASSVVDSIPKLQATPVPKVSKPWAPFWRGLIRNQQGSYEVVSRDTCFNPSSTGIDIEQVPRCWNGTRAHVAFFAWTSCQGTPDFYNSNDKGALDHQFCFDHKAGYGSIAFWCQGPKPRVLYASPPRIWSDVELLEATYLVVFILLFISFGRSWLWQKWMKRASKPRNNPI